jgi:hypothetical protein
MIHTIRNGAAAAIAALVVGLGACGTDRSDEDTRPAAETIQLAPEQQMQTSLQRVVDAQARHFADHQRFADSVQTLVDEYGFQIVGEEQVSISFAEAQTDPRWGYVATAIHPFSNQRCEVLHGRSTDGREFTGQIVCEGPAEGPEQPQEPAMRPQELEAGSDPQPVAPGTGPDAQRVLPPTETDTVRPEQRRP